jgi:superfamily II DNA/RNA helicase
MSSFPTDVLLERAGGLDEMRKVAERAKIVLAKDILTHIAEQNGKIHIPLDLETMQKLTDALNILELRVLDLSHIWRRKPLSQEGKDLRECASLVFDIRRVLPMGKTTEECVKKFICLAAAGVLGDRTSDVRRYLNENEWPVPDTMVAPSDVDTDWPRLVLFNVAKAFLCVVRKKDWKDIHTVAHAIAMLRENQKKYEGEYLRQNNGIRQAAAFELVAFYQLAKAIEILGMYIGQGIPQTILDDTDFHFSSAIKAADATGIVELSLLLHWMKMSSVSIIRATVWHQLAAYNSRITDFKKVLTDEKQLRPLFELLPPQCEAIQEVMNTGNRAVVVEMPTSSGKTLLAEFRIIQTKVNVANAWIAYLVPTRALVNQITFRLRRDLDNLGIKVEQATPAFELDGFEEELLTMSDSFDVLVTTPEKLDLLMRSDVTKENNNRPLGLVILDEAHNLGDGERGLRSELVLAMINRESPDTHFLLLTPFVPNAQELATWLDSERSKSITPSLSVNWQPNDRLLALVYPKGKGKVWGLVAKPLHVNIPHRSIIAFDEPVTIQHEKPHGITYSEAKSSKNNIAAITAEALSQRGNSVVLAFSPTDCWNIAGKLAKNLPEKNSAKLALVREFTESEYGSDFMLCELLRKGIGVHHAGISPEMRTILEWLAEEDELAVLVATTTLAQGVNFPISNVILSTTTKPLKKGDYYGRKDLSPEEFWNIAGRAGRLFQETLGLVFFASQTSDNKKIETFVNANVVALASVLEQMIEDTIEKGWDLDLRWLVRNDVKWSSFVQYLSHCYRKIDDHTQFLADTEKLLKRTYAYHRLSLYQPEIAEQLIESTRLYAEQLHNLPPGVLTLVDNTGFSPESITELLKDKSSFNMKVEDWSPSRLFQAGGVGMRNLIGALLKVPEIDIPTIGDGNGNSIAEMINMWVNGKSLREIADAHFINETDVSRRLTDCCRLVYQTLSHQGSWGVGALQSLSGLADTQLSLAEKEAIRCVPSMIYFGVPTVEAVLMRSLGVPRSLSVKLGEQFIQSENVKEKIPRIQKARSWLDKTPESTWQTAAEQAGITMRGERLQQIWHIITGKT